MNCQLCQKELDAYLMGKSPVGTRIQVEEHLGMCSECAESYRLVKLATDVISEEKDLKSNPFLVTKIMAGIEEAEQKHERYITIPIYQNLIKSALMTGSVAAAMFIGILVGNIYKPTPRLQSLPTELASLNDAALESVDLFSIE
jgi:predicted anti-sigma-YlaC factor YlaD